MIFNFSIVLDARVSIVTVAKLVDIKVNGSCKCPDRKNDYPILGRIVKKPQRKSSSSSSSSSSDSD